MQDIRVYKIPTNHKTIKVQKPKKEKRTYELAIFLSFMTKKVKIKSVHAEILICSHAYIRIKI